MRQHPLAFATLLLLISSAATLAQNARTPSAQEAKIATAVKAVLEAQRDAWNRGDIEGYMDGYARSENTVFVSGDNVNRGWQNVLNRYKKNYNLREKMGVLTFSDLDISPIGTNAAVVLGRWHLQRTNDEPHGRFTLILKKMKQGWKIVHDHTSAAAG